MEFSKHRSVFSKILFWVFAIAVVCFIFPYQLISQCNFINWDQSGYYYYLPAAFIYHDFNYLHWLNEALANYQQMDFEGKVMLASNHAVLIKYPVGVAIMQLPFFLLAYVAAFLFHFPIDGFSFPFQLGVYFSGLFYFLLGGYFTWKFIRFYYDSTIAKMAVAIMSIGSYILFYGAGLNGLSHIYGYACVAIFFYAIHQLKQQKEFKNFIFSGVAFALAFLCRNTNAMILIPAFFLLRADLKNIFSKIHFGKIFITLLLMSGLLLLQMLYWHNRSGFWILNLYKELGEWFDFKSPHILNGLLSKKKGWFNHSFLSTIAVFSVIFFCLDYKKHAVLFSLFIAIWIYVIFSWYAWDYCGGIPSRAAIEITPILTLFLASLINFIKSKKRIKIIATAILIVLVYANVLQSWSATHGYYEEEYMPRFQFVKNTVLISDCYDYYFKYKNYKELQPQFIESKKLLFSKSYTAEDSAVVYAPDSKTEYRGIFNSPAKKLFIKQGDWIRISGSGYYEYRNQNLGNNAKVVLSITNNQKSTYWRCYTFLMNTTDTVIRFPLVSKTWYADFKLSNPINSDDEFQTFFWNNGNVKYWINDIKIEKLNLKK